jgi:hypothetical protein
MKSADIADILAYVGWSIFVINTCFFRSDYLLIIQIVIFSIALGLLIGEE